MKAEKKIYESSELEIVALSNDDVIATSGWNIGGGDDDNTDPGGWT